MKGGHKESLPGPQDPVCPFELATWSKDHFALHPHLCTVNNYWLDIHIDSNTLIFYHYQNVFSQCSSIFKFPTSFSGIEFPELLCRLKEQWRAMPTAPTLLRARQPRDEQALDGRSQFYYADSWAQNHSGRDWRSMEVCGLITQLTLLLRQTWRPCRPHYTRYKIWASSLYMLNKGFQKSVTQITTLWIHFDLQT